MNQKEKLKIYIPMLICIAMVIIGSACLCLAVSMEYDLEVGYFNRDSIYATVLYVSVAIGFVSAIAAWVLNFKKSVVDRPVSDGAISTSVMYALMGIAIAFSMINDILTTLSSAPTAYEFMHYLMWVLAFLGAISCFVAPTKRESTSPVRVLVGFAVPMFIAAKVLIVYFDRTVAVNSPLKILMQVALVCLMLALAEEAGVSLGRTYIFPRLLFALCIATVVGGIVGIGGIILNVLGQTVAPISVSDGVLIFIISAYCYSRLMVFAKAETVITKKSDK